jgi:hypothetical protein
VRVSEVDPRLPWETKFVRVAPGCGPDPIPIKMLLGDRAAARTSF